MTIVLTGFMGAGKTTVGQALSEALGMTFVDLDREVEAMDGRGIREIFSTSGEEYFRELERQQLEAALAGDERVVATGGGTLVNRSSMELAKARGLVIWLNPAFATLVARVGPMGKSDRPLFQDEKAVFDLYRQRLESYRHADLRVDIDAQEQPAEVAARIALKVVERTCSI